MNLASSLTLFYAGVMYVSPRYGLGPVTRHPHSSFGKGAGNMGVAQTSHIHGTQCVCLASMTVSVPCH